MITTTAELVKRAQLAADMHDGPFTPTQWTYWATQENLALAVFLARSGWTQNVKTTTITVAGTEAGAFALDVDPLAIVAVHQIGTDGRVRRLKCNNAVDFLRQTVSSTSTSGDPVEYRVLWDQDNDGYVMNFFPQPTAGSQFLVSYIGHPKKLTLTGSPTYATATLGDLTLQALVAGSAGNGIEIEAQLDNPATNVQFTASPHDTVYTQTVTPEGEGPILNPITWAMVATALADSTQVEVVSGSSSAEIPATLYTTVTTSGGEDSVAAEGYALSVSYPLGYEEWIVLRMAINARDTEESETVGLEKRFARVQSHIEQSVWDRVFADAKVRNVDEVERGWTNKIVYPPTTEWWFV